MNTNMNNGMIELTLEELALADGGWNWKKWVGNIGVTATLGGLTGGMIALAASGPVGWAVIGGAVAGAAGAAIYSALTDD